MHRCVATTENQEPAKIDLTKQGVLAHLFPLSLVFTGIEKRDVPKENCQKRGLIIQQNSTGHSSGSENSQ